MTVDPAWVALSLTRHLGGKTFKALLAAFDQDLEAILMASPADLRKVPGIGPKIANAITEINLQAVSTAITRWEAAGVSIIPADHPGYPTPLRRVDDAPPTLFVRGELPDFSNAYAIVGTRHPANPSREITERLAMAIVSAGGMVVSGMALGIDVHAHRSTLAASGITVGVLGSGVGNIYPPQNRKIAEAVLLRGALLSEVAPLTPVSAPQLVARNRLITGLSKAVIIVETQIDGGAMHAARFARLQGIPIYAVEHTASGNQDLLKNGAQAIKHNLDGLDL